MGMEQGEKIQPQKVEPKEVNAYKTYKRYKYVKKYRYKKVYRNGRVRYVRAVYYYKYSIRSGGKGVGDCWTNSDYLYNKLKKQGYHVRIIQYPTSYSARHRSVQIYKNGHWVNFDYKGEGYAWRYYATSNSKYGKVIKCT